MASAQKIKVCVLEDNEKAGKVLVEVLESSDEFILVSWCRTAESALKCLPEKDVDILIADIQLPGMNGLRCIEEVSHSLPQIKTVVYTIFEDEQKIIDAIRLGAKGYILKDTPPDLFLAELKVIMLGGAPLTPRIAHKIISILPSESTVSSRDNPISTHILSDRETEIINLVALGLTYSDIGKELHISTHTVRSHIENIYQKLDVHNKSEALKKCRSEGLLGD